MQTEPFKKTFITSFVAMLLTLSLLLTTVQFAAAYLPGAVMDAPPLTVPVTIDGNWTSGEWDDAPQYNMTNSTGGNIGYILAKYSSTHLYVLIDSPWDTTNAIVYPQENVWFAFDTLNDGGTAPQSDDYLIHIGASWIQTYSWNGTGSGWQQMLISGVSSVQAGMKPPPTAPLHTSPNDLVTPHRISEIAIPLTYVGSINSTVGFYILVDDDSTDPDETGDLPATAYSEWPTGAGGSPAWPNSSSSAPCPAPNAWGNLYLSPHAWDISPEFGLIDIMDILIVAMAFGSTPSDPHWNPVADITEEWGLIDIMDILVIAMHFGESY